MRGTINARNGIQPSYDNNNYNNNNKNKNKNKNNKNNKNNNIFNGPCSFVRNKENVYD